jgi:hypothetical protein
VSAPRTRHAQGATSGSVARSATSSASTLSKSVGRWSSFLLMCPLLLLRLWALLASYPPARLAPDPAEERFRLYTGPCTAKGYPMTIQLGAFVRPDGKTMPVPVGHTLEGKWGLSSIGQVLGDEFQPVPGSLEILYFSYLEDSFLLRHRRGWPQVHSQGRRAQRSRNPYFLSAAAPNASDSAYQPARGNGQGCQGRSLRARKWWPAHPLDEKPSSDCSIAGGTCI